ncbi:MAG: flagellin [bacterium]
MSMLTNVSSMGALNCAYINNLSIRKGTEHLSSGYQMNRGADDPSGLAIAKGMKAQTGGLRTAIVNAQECLNYLQVRDAAMSEIGDMIERIRDLAVRAANDATLTDSDRQKLENEARELVKNMNMIDAETRFNGRKVFDHSFDMVPGWGGPYSQPGHPGQAFATIDLAELAAANGGVAVITGAWYNGEQDFPDLNLISPNGTVNGREAFGYYNVAVLGGYEAYTGGIDPETIDNVTTPTLDSADQIDYSGYRTPQTPGGWYEESFAITNPMAGQWTILVDNESPDDRYYAFFYNNETVTDPTPHDAGQIGPDNGDNFILHLDTFQVTSTALGVSASIGSVSGAQDAITSADSALAKLNDHRADTGILQNKLEKIINDNTAQVINNEASRSRIEDAEMASEITTLTKSQILEQTNMTAINAANNMPSNALELFNMSTNA